MISLPSHQASVPIAAVFAIGLGSLAASAAPPDNPTGGTVKSQERSGGWQPSPPVRSSQSRPPAVPAVEDNPDFGFSPKMSADRAALRQSKVLRLPVVRSGRKGAASSADRAETEDLGKALSSYQKAGGGESPEGRQALQAFLGKHGDGDYAPSIRLELAGVLWRTGAWDKALGEWDAAWAGAAQADPEDVEARRLGDVALSELLLHHGLLGRKERLRTVLDEISGREFGGDASNAIRRAKELLWFLDNRAEQNVFCGFSAANLVCVPAGQKAIYPDVHDEAEKKSFIASGASLWDIAEHSAEGGGNLRCVRKTDEHAPFAVPSVVHWGFGHYSALTEKSDDGQLLLSDAQLKFNSWVDPTVIAEGLTGYALIPGGTELPQGYREVPEEEARKVFGRHCIHGYDDEGTDCESGCGGASKGMATYSLNLRRAYHTLTDTPVSYFTPGGSEVLFGLKYSAVPAVGSSLTNTYGFGPNWFATFAGGSIELKGTGTPNSSIEWRIGTGNYHSYTLSGGVYTKKQAELPSLTYLNAAAGGPGYRLTYSDGSLQDYTAAANSPTTRYLLARQVDAQGQIRTFGYDGQARLVSYTDEWGLVSVISYDAFVTGSANLIRTITDPHGRSATFDYDPSGRLKKITDPVGIESEFGYGTGDVVNTLKTPYGTTTFALSWGALNSTVTVTDPREFKERVVQMDLGREPSQVPTELQLFGSGGNLVSGLPNLYRVRDWDANGEYGDADAQAPTSVNGVTFIPKNNNLHWRNSFYWDKKAMFHAENNGVIDWNLATVYNWKADSASYIVPALSSMRSPGQGRIWFNYPGQTGADGAISSYQPSKTVRQVEQVGGPVWIMTQQTYNPLGLPLEYVTEEGVRYRINYAANQQDVESVEGLIFPPGGDPAGLWQTLQSFTYPTPSLHVPETSWTRGGASATFSYNSRSQTTEVNLSENGEDEKVRYTYSPSGITAVPAWPGSPGFLRKIERQDPSAPGGWVATEVFTYDSVGRIRTHTDATGYHQTLDYDDLDRVTVITHPDGTTEELSYLHLDLSAVKDRAGRWSQIEYNSERQPVKQIAADGKTTLLDWCLCGQLQKLTDPMNRETKWTWAPGGFLKEKLMPDGVTKTTYTYEPMSGRLSTVTNPNEQGSGGPTVTYGYTRDGRLKKEDYSDPGTSDVSYSYASNLLGRLSMIGDGVGTYNLIYRGIDPGIRQIDGPFANDLLSYTYGLNGRVSSEKLLMNPTETVPYGMLYGETSPIRSETSILDPLGRMKRITNELGTHDFTYNTPLARPDRVTGPNGLVTDLSYRPNVASAGTSRLLRGITHRRGAVTQAQHAYQHDSAGRITGWERESIGQPAKKGSYDYSLGDELVRAQERDLPSNTVTDQQAWGLDDAGNWLSHTRGSQMETRSFNSLNRLTRIGGAGSAVIDGHVNEFAQVWVDSQPTPITPDPVSNGYRFRRSVAVTEGVNTVQITATDQSAQTTSQNWRFSVPAASRNFTYDANGNSLSDGVRTYTWDAKNRLKTVTKAGVTWKWDYDYRDRRVKEYQDNVLTKIFIWSGDRLIQERNAANIVTRTHYAGGFIDGADPATGTKYQTLADHLGNVREVLTASGTVAARYTYTPYQGPVKVGSSTVDPTFLTIGNYYHHAGSGLELALYRAYDPELGRWLSADPMNSVIGEVAEMLPEGSNLYSFVGNGPITFSDPLGLYGPGYGEGFAQLGANLRGAHHERNIYNKKVPRDPSTKYPAGKSIYHVQGHCNGVSNITNTKHVSKDGKNETVYNKDGNVVGDPVNMGTYNYGTNMFTHFILDVVPYYILGNSEDDPTTFLERLTAGYKGNTCNRR